MFFFFLLCCASFVRRPSRKSGAASPPPWKCSSEGATSGRAGAVGDAVRAMDESAGAEKPGPENAEAADTKNHVQLCERSEETIYDRRELIGMTLMTTLLVS